MRFSFSWKIGFLRTAFVAALFVVSQSASADVVKIVVDDAIHPIVTERIERAIHEADRTHADALLIELRTPGGLVSETIEITHAILSSPVPVIIYVSPAG
ncbi:MAG TPA: nodulation protein NfeD, partial [Candidatus Angelobacter sp.]|nr:nodulation protein NfeD [Candidatus Angelobacter sp.]